MKRKLRKNCSENQNNVSLNFNHVIWEPLFPNTHTFLLTFSDSQFFFVLVFLSLCFLSENKISDVNHLGSILPLMKQLEELHLQCEKNKTNSKNSQNNKNQSIKKTNNRITTKTRNDNQKKKKIFRIWHKNHHFFLMNLKWKLCFQTTQTHHINTRISFSFVNTCPYVVSWTTQTPNFRFFLACMAPLHLSALQIRFFFSLSCWHTLLWEEGDDDFDEDEKCQLDWDVAMFDCGRSPVLIISLQWTNVTEWTVNSRDKNSWWWQRKTKHKTRATTSIDQSREVDWNNLKPSRISTSPTHPLDFMTAQTSFLSMFAFHSLAMLHMTQFGQELGWWVLNDPPLHIVNKICDLGEEQAISEVEGEHHLVTWWELEVFLQFDPRQALRLESFFFRFSVCTHWLLFGEVLVCKWRITFQMHQCSFKVTDAGRLDHCPNTSQHSCLSWSPLPTIFGLRCLTHSICLGLGKLSQQSCSTPCLGHSESSVHLVSKIAPNKSWWCVKNQCPAFFVFAWSIGKNQWNHKVVGMEHRQHKDCSWPQGRFSWAVSMNAISWTSLTCKTRYWHSPRATKQGWRSGLFGSLNTSSLKSCPCQQNKTLILPTQSQRVKPCLFLSVQVSQARHSWSWSQTVWDAHGYECHLVATCDWHNGARSTHVPFHNTNTGNNKHVKREWCQWSSFSWFEPSHNCV